MLECSRCGAVFIYKHVHKYRFILNKCKINSLQVTFARLLQYCIILKMFRQVPNIHLLATKL